MIFVPKRYSQDVVGIAQLVRAPDCGSGGHRFDSDYPPHFFLYPFWGKSSDNLQKFNIGVSSSGKTQHFDCCIRRFESCHPSQKSRSRKWTGFYLLPITSSLIPQIFDSGEQVKIRRNRCGVPTARITNARHSFTSISADSSYLWT